LLSLEVTASLAEQAVDISGVQPKVAVMSLTLNRPKSNEHDQQYAHQTHGFVAPLSKAQFNRIQMHPEMPRAVIVDPTRALNEAAARHCGAHSDLDYERMNTSLSGCLLRL
jgi:hypothetical protein